MIDPNVEFYKKMPFNKVSPHQLRHDQPISLPLFDHYVTGAKRVCEVGCGNGWLSNRIYHWSRIPVHGIDLIHENIEQAQRTSEGASFSVDNLFNYEYDADFIVSIGVLHHTFNVYEAFEHLLRQSADRLYLGLYDKQRQAVFDYFSRYEDKWKQFQSITENLIDTRHQYSWYRDQLEHPQETFIETVRLSELAEKHGYEMWILRKHSYNEIMDSLESGKFMAGMSYFGLQKNA